MLNLVNNPSLIIMSVFGFLFFSGIVYNIFNYLRELDLFRDNIKTGDLVKVKTQQEVIRARVVSIHDKHTVVVRDIDTRELTATQTTKIYKP